MKKIQLNYITRLVFFIMACYSTLSNADINVFTCEPEWQSLAQELGGEKVTTFSATNGLQDPHQVQARPSLITKMRDAQLLICSGADLEVGWLPLLLRRASNGNLHVGKPGYFMAANYVRLLGVPKVIDRSQGDVHAAGNPHIQTSPVNIERVAKALVKTLQQIDPDNAEYYQQRADVFQKRWKTSLKKWKAQARKIRGSRIIVQHASWDYLNDFAKLDQIATLEDKPGIPATSGHLNKLLSKLKKTPASVIIRAAYQDGRSSQWLSRKSGVPVVVLPFTVGGSDKAKTLFGLYDETFDLLSDAILPQAANL